MFKRQLLQNVLDTYIVKANEVIDQISIREFLNGKLTLRNLTLKAETIQDLYGSYLPVSTEVLSCQVAKLNLSIPWISLNSTPCAVEVEEASLVLRLRCPVLGSESKDAQEVRFWHEQAERLASAVARSDQRSQLGAQKPSLLDRVLGALAVKVKRLRLELWRPDARGPSVLGTIDGIRFQPTTKDWQLPKNINETVLEVPELREHRIFVLVEIESIAVETVCGGATAHLRHLVIKTVGKRPSLPPLRAPPTCTSHRAIEVGPLTITGSEEPLTVLLAAVNDIYSGLGMTDPMGHLAQGYLPKLDEVDVGEECSKPIRTMQSLLKMHRKTVMNFENLVCDTSRRASIASSAGANVQDDGAISGPGSNGNESDDSEAFEDAISDSNDAMMGVLTSASREQVGERPEEGPVAAVGRKTVTLASAELRVELPAGELLLRLGRLSYLADAVQPLSAAAQKCCADLFKVPVSSQAEPPLGTILMELQLRGGEVMFHATGQPRKQSGNFEPSLVARLVEQDPPPLRLAKRGSGAPVPCGELHAEPMQLSVVGLQLQVGRGLDQLRTWWGRLSPRLPQLMRPQTSALPAACLTAHLLQTTVVQEPTDPSHLTVSGSWPMRITLPMLEVKSTSSILELPASVRASFSSNADFEERKWWQSLFVPSPASRLEQTERESLAKEGSVEARLLAAEQMVQWLEQQNEELRAKANQTQGLARWMRRSEQRPSSSPGTSCCAAPLTAWLSKRQG